MRWSASRENRKGKYAMKEAASNLGNKSEVVEQIKNCERLLNLTDIQCLVGRPKSWIRKLLKSGLMKGCKLGGNNWRVTQKEFKEWVGKGCPCGARNSQPSGSCRR